MITKLTKEQEARFPEFVKKWTDIGLSTEKANRKEAEIGVYEAYKIAGLKKPEVVWCDSPLSQGITRMIVQKLESEGKLNKKSIGENVRASVRDSVWDSVGDSVYGQHDANWLAFYDFFAEVIKLEKETEKLNGLWKIAKNAGWFLPHENICWVSERPNELHRNTQGRLHNTKGMALKYPDGWGIYAINGVRFDENLFKKITSEKVTAQDILSIEDIDQRTQAMRFLSPESMVKELNGELLDEYNKFDIEGNPVNYKLYKFPKGSVFLEDAYYCLFDCPSTRKKHMEGVEVSKTVPEAMAWAEELSPEDWKLRVPLKEEV